MELYELTPKDSRKSFYRKAFVIIANGKKYLKSYDTIVASIDENGTIYRYWADWSATTGRHLIAFAGINKKAWDAMPVTPCELK